MLVERFMVNLISLHEKKKLLQRTMIYRRTEGAFNNGRKSMASSIDGDDLNLHLWYYEKCPAGNREVYPCTLGHSFGTMDSSSLTTTCDTMPSSFRSEIVFRIDNKARDTTIISSSITKTTRATLEDFNPGIKKVN